MLKYTDYIILEDLSAKLLEEQVKLFLESHVPLGGMTVHTRTIDGRFTNTFYQTMVKVENEKRETKI